MLYPQNCIIPSLLSGYWLFSVVLFSTYGKNHIVQSIKINWKFSQPTRQWWDKISMLSASLSLSRFSLGKVLWGKLRRKLHGKPRVYVIKARLLQPDKLPCFAVRWAQRNVVENEIPNILSFVLLFFRQFFTRKVLGRFNVMQMDFSLTFRVFHHWYFKKHLHLMWQE